MRLPLLLSEANITKLSAANRDSLLSSMVKKSVIVLGDVSLIEGRC